MSSKWPPYNNPKLTSEERRLLIDITLTRLIEKAEKAEKIHIFDHEDLTVLKTLVKAVRASTMVWRILAVSAPILTVLTYMLAGWDKVIIAAQSIVNIFK